MGYKKSKFTNAVNYERHPRGTCGKIIFSKKDAQTKRNTLMKLGNEKYLRIYPCDICSGWHLTKAVYFGKRRFEE